MVVEHGVLLAVDDDELTGNALKGDVLKRAMSGAFDQSNASISQPELSLGSLASFAATPSRSAFRVPSASSRTTAQSSALVATPPSASAFSRRNAAHHDHDDSMADESKWADAPETPAANARSSKRAKGATGVTLTLRDQEKHIDSLKKENFDIKLRVHFLEERLAQLAPDQIDAALKQNINLKIEVQQRGMEIKKLKKLVLSLEHELERLQRTGAGASTGRERERELEDKLEEREREIQELRRRRSDDDDDALREAQERNAELEEDLQAARALIEENVEEMERMRDVLERRGDESANESFSGTKRRIQDLEADNQELRSRIAEQTKIIANKEEEKEDLVDEIDALRLELEDVQRRREAENIERSESRALVLEERDHREAVEDDMNAMRDKLAALLIELQQREDEVDVKNKEIDDLVAEHQRIVEVVEEEWKGEVEEARTQVEELRDILAERETESKDLREHITDLESASDDLHAKFETALAHLETEAEGKDEELESLREANDKLGEEICKFEDEMDRMREEYERMREEDAAEKEKLEAVATALKEKIADLKDELQQRTEMYESLSQDVHAHRERQEELAAHVEDLVAEVQRERAARERTEAELDAADKEHDAALRREKRALEAKESALQSALNDLGRAQSLLTQREADLAAVQGALQTIEMESKRLGETHTTARFSLQLEADRMKRDLERLEDELARARRELDDREHKTRDRDSVVDKLHAENRDLATQLAAQTQARLNISEKLDAVLANLKSAEGEVASYKAKVLDMEQKLGKDQRSLLNVESQYRDQLTERNTLLLTIYQYLDKILGVDKTPKKGTQGETKPFTNFSVFHDNLITRLKALSQIQMDFEKRCKDVEARFQDKFNDLRKQLDNRWKQIDKFESSLKSVAETKASWKRKFSQKEGELEAIKATNVEMANQLAGMKRPGGGDAMELRSMAARAANAERRLNNAQNQLLASEEKMAAMSQKTMSADSKWEARVKEYEARLKAAEERVKRERQGTKERIMELENNLKSIQRQLELAQKRNSQLNDVMDANKASASRTNSPAR